MESELESGKPAPGRRPRRKPASDVPELSIVGSNDAASPVARRRPEKVLTRGDILSVDFFEKQPIVGTELAVREQSVNEKDAMGDDEANAEIDDREFTVRTLARQLVGDPVPDIDEVRAWSDDRLLAGARAMLSFPPLKYSVNGVEHVPDPDEIVAIPDPLTFASFREAITAVPKRQSAKLAETARRISELRMPRIGAMFDGGTLAAIRASQTSAFGLGSAIGQATESMKNNPAFSVKVPAALLENPALKMRLPELDFMKGSVAGIGALTDTAGIAGSLAKFADRTVTMGKLAGPIEVPAPEPLTFPAIRTYHPEVDAIHAVGERIEAMAENQAAADREALEVMTGLTELIRNQGTATQGVIAEVKGLRADQRWPNRAVIVGAFLAGALLVVGAITAIPIIKELFRL
jgi:hypothetical protein